MATNSRQARREAEKKRREYAQNYLDRFTILFHNAVEIKSCEAPKRYILEVLYNQGAIAYDLKTKLYLPFVSIGIDVYGLPQAYNLIGFNGVTFMRKPEEVVILRANDKKIPLCRYFQQQVNKLVDLDLAIEQNLDSIKTMTIAEVDDESQMLTLANMYESRRVGATVCYVNKNPTNGLQLRTYTTGAQYLVDKLQEARKVVLNETLSTIGISVANTEKRERVQSVEVLASQGYAMDCLSTLVDTFNYDAEQGGIPDRLEANTSLSETVELSKENKEVTENNEL